MCKRALTYGATLNFFHGERVSKSTLGALLRLRQSNHATHTEWEPISANKKARNTVATIYLRFTIQKKKTWKRKNQTTTTKRNKYTADSLYKQQTTTTTNNKNNNKQQQQERSTPLIRCYCAALCANLHTAVKVKVPSTAQPPPTGQSTETRRLQMPLGETTMIDVVYLEFLGNMRLRREIPVFYSWEWNTTFSKG